MPGAPDVRRICGKYPWKISSKVVSAVSRGALSAIDNGRILARELGDIRKGWMERITAGSDLPEDASVLRRRQTRQERRRNMVWQAEDLLTAMDAFAARAGRRSPGI